MDVGAVLGIVSPRLRRGLRVGAAGAATAVIWRVSPHGCPTEEEETHETRCHRSDPLRVHRRVCARSVDAVVDAERRARAHRPTGLAP